MRAGSENLDLALHGCNGAMLRNPRELVLSALQISAQVLVGLSLDGAVTAVSYRFRAAWPSAEVSEYAVTITPTNAAAIA